LKEKKGWEILITVYNTVIDNGRDRSEPKKRNLRKVGRRGMGEEKEEL
jgi:hypothetical protein